MPAVIAAAERPDPRGVRLPAVLGARPPSLASTSTTTSSRRSRTSASPAQSDGTLLEDRCRLDGWTSATMTDVINRAHAKGVEVVLTVTMMAWGGDYTAMSALLNSAPARAAGRPTSPRRLPPAMPTASTSTSSRCRTRSSRSTRAFVREVKAALVAAGPAATSRSRPPAARQRGTRATTSPG